MEFRKAITRLRRDYFFFCRSRTELYLCSRNHVPRLLRDHALAFSRVQSSLSCNIFRRTRVAYSGYQSRGSPISYSSSIIDLRDRRVAGRSGSLEQISRRRVAFPCAIANSATGLAFLFHLPSSHTITIALRYSNALAILDRSATQTFLSFAAFLLLLLFVVAFRRQPCLLVCFQTNRNPVFRRRFPWKGFFPFRAGSDASARLSGGHRESFTASSLNLALDHIGKDRPHRLAGSTHDGGVFCNVIVLQTV